MLKRYFLSIILLAALSGCSPHYYLNKQNASQTKIEQAIPEDMKTVKLYEPYKLKVDSQMNAVIGSSSVEMQKGQPESTLGNFFADAIATTISRRNIPYDFAMPSTNGGMRAGMPKGEIRMRHAFELMPFENSLYILTLTGKDVQSLGDYIVKSNGQPVSGMTIATFVDRPAEILVRGQQIDPAKEYRVLTSDYLANGGDGITAFAKPVRSEALNIKVRDAIIEYIQTETRQGRILNPQTDGRIRLQ